MQQHDPVPKDDNYKCSQYLEVLFFLLDYFLIKMRDIRQKLITLCFEIWLYSIKKQLQTSHLVDWLQIKKANTVILPAFSVGY